MRAEVGWRRACGDIGANQEHQEALEGPVHWRLDIAAGLELHKFAPAFTQAAISRLRPTPSPPLCLFSSMHRMITGLQLVLQT